jgi:KTSC domain
MTGKTPVIKSVYSSHVNTIAYNKDSQELHVVWDTGKKSIYSGVPEPLATRVMNDWSVGAALHSEIKGKFSHRYGD